MENELEEILNSLINGQRRQMVLQIEDYGLYDFWADFKGYLSELYSEESQYKYFTDATISYFRITNR